MKFDKTISREIALQGIYQDIVGTPRESITKLSWVDEVFKEEMEYRNKEFILNYSKKILETYFSKKEKVEELFKKFYTKNQETISTIDKSILFLGITMILLNDTSYKVVIDEIVNISKSYGSTNTVYKMVNKFIDTLIKIQNITESEHTKHHKEIL
ncbi:MAG: transcription antitermination factor NusB [Brevinematia bacterium]